ncbi:MAG: hypothetical protein AB1633_00240 [Elusimicrobiota bacterium]
MKLNLTSLIGQANISVNINVNPAQDGKLNAYITISRNHTLPGNPSTALTQETYNYTETSADLITKINNDLGLGVLIE